MKLTVVGCSGSVSGPESPASSYLVQAPYAGSHLLAGARLRSRRLRRPVPLYRSRRCRRLRPQPPASRPLPRPLRLLRRRALLADRAVATAVRSSARPAPHAARPGVRGDRVNGEPASPAHPWPSSSTSQTWQPRQQIGPFIVATTRSTTRSRRTRIRVTEDIPGGGAWSTPATPARATPWSTWPRAPTCCWWSPRSWTVPDNPPGLHLTGRAGRRGRASGRRRRRGAYPHPAVARPRPGAGRGDAALRRPAVTRHARCSLGDRLRGIG